LGPSACGCKSRRRVSTARSAASQTPSDVRIWRARPGAPSERRARTAAAVLSEAGGEAAAVSGAAALLWARVRGPSVAACRCMRTFNYPKGSITAVSQLSRHCWVDVDVVALPPRAGLRGRCGGIGKDEPGSPMSVFQDLPAAGPGWLVRPFQGLQQAGKRPDALGGGPDVAPAQRGNPCSQ